MAWAAERWKERDSLCSIDCQIYWTPTIGKRNRCGVRCERLRPRHLPTEVIRNDITVRFARDLREADDLLEYLVEHTRHLGGSWLSRAVIGVNGQQSVAKQKPMTANRGLISCNSTLEIADEEPFRKPLARNLDAGDVAEWMSSRFRFPDRP